MTISKGDLAPAQNRLIRQRLSRVSMDGQDWLWEGRIPLGGVMLLTGEPEAGKTTILVDIIARSTMGADWPDGSGKAPEGYWLYVTTENDTERTIKPRLVAAGGDPGQVEVIKGTEVKTKTISQRGVDLAQDIAELEKVIREPCTDGECIGVVFDPLNEYLGEKVDSWKDADVRRVLGPLAALAEKHQIAVIGVLHPRKGEASTVLNKIAGAKAFTAFARCASLCIRDNEPPDGDTVPVSVFIPIKNNLGRKPKGLKYIFEDVKPRPTKGDDPVRAARVGMMPKVQWLGETDKTAEELSAPQSDRQDGAEKTINAAVLILQQLMGGPKPADHMDRIRQDAAIGDSSWRRARKKLEQADLVRKEGSGREVMWRLGEGKTSF